MFIAGLIVGTALASAAWAAYWDFSGYMAQYSYYLESTTTSSWGENRLSRGTNCGAKKDAMKNSGGYFRIPAPAGCATYDWTTDYPSDTYWGSRCINADGPDPLWLNCRIVPL